MIRERALQVFLVLLGIFFCLGVYPIAMMLRHPDPAEDTGDGMMLSLYVTMGILLLLAVRNPVGHRSLIVFTAWSSLAHAVVMGTMGLQFASQREGFLIGSGLLVMIFLVLLGLMPNKRRKSPARDDRVPAP